MIDPKDKDLRTSTIFEASEDYPRNVRVYPLRDCIRVPIHTIRLLLALCRIDEYYNILGETQFLAIGLFMNLAPITKIAVTTLLLNLRHSFFGLSLIRKFFNIPRVKPYLILHLLMRHTPFHFDG